MQFSTPRLQSLSSLLFITSLAQYTHARSQALQARAVTVPAPIAVPPAQNWEGIDGLWNTFALQLGTPAQTVRVLISTASQQTWAVAPIGCTGMNQTICDSARGGDFDPKVSTTWTQQGNYKLHVEENLGYNSPQDIATYGYDTVKVGYSGENGPMLQNQVIGSFATYDFYYGHLGINPKPTNWTDYNKPYPSFITNLKNQSIIPSVSWGYTAGAYYRQAHVLSSLTLGGYDSARFTPNNVTWTLGSDNERDILVAVQNIMSGGGSNPIAPLIPSSFTSPVYAYIDSTVAEFWLPTVICDLFAQTYNLTYNSTTELYHVSDATHTRLLAANPTITFTLGVQAAGGQTVQIALPYAAFDLTAQAPYQGLTGPQRYFPLRRAANDTQYTLGRAFLQEAYLIVDWERGNFSVSQCVWPESGLSQHLKAISAVDTGSSVGGISGGVIAGIVTIIVAIILTMVAIVFCMVRRRRQKRAAASTHTKASKQSSIDDMSTMRTMTSNAGTLVEPRDNVLPKVELDASQTPKGFEDTGFFGLSHQTGVGSPVDSEAGTWINPIEADGKEREIFEMPGDYPKMPEADSRQFSEKEAMRAREERYNGVDSVSPISPATQQHLQQQQTRSPVSPADVVEVIDRVGPRGNPVSPISGSSSDGSHTMLFSPLSPLDGTIVNSISPIATMPGRKRFSYELDEEEQQAGAGAGKTIEDR